MEKPIKLSELFERCNNIAYKQTAKHCGDFAHEIIDRTLYIYFQPSNCKHDWYHNFLFFSKKVKHDSHDKKWRCHGGYLKVWNEIKPHIKQVIRENYIYTHNFDRVILVGYSHVAAICHDWLWYNYKSLRDRLVGYGFGCPRVFCNWFGIMPKRMKERWANFHPVRCGKDLVTHVPFAFLGFRHSNKIIKIGKGKKLGLIKSHYPEQYKEALEESNLVV